MKRPRGHYVPEPRFRIYQQMLAALGTPLLPGTTILDFGCGSGELVAEAHGMGFDAYGCDIDFSSEWVDQVQLADLIATNRVLRINRGDAGKASPQPGVAYRLPFGDNTFDVVISDQVFEHVGNYRETISELYRVMKPGATMLHLFPSRYKPIEPHILVPFAQLLPARWWLWPWALLGVRNENQHGLTARQTVEQNVAFMLGMTNYLTGKQLRDEFGRGFRATNVERLFMRFSKRARLFLVPALYRTLWSRCIAAVKV